MKSNRREDVQLQRYLNKLLNEMPLLEPEAGFTDKVMNKIVSPDRRSREGEFKDNRFKWKKKIGHGLVATAATFMLISTGLLNRLLTINDQLAQLPIYINKLSSFL
jgi:hypothetical protein